MYNIRKNLSISDKGNEILTIEITNKNMLLPCCYRLLKGVTENLTVCLASIFQGVQNEERVSFIISNFNLNYLNYNENSNIRHVYHKVFELGFIPLINRPTRVCKTSATIIGSLLTN